MARCKRVTQAITSLRTGEVIFKAKVPASYSRARRLGAALKIAINESVWLRCANFAGANLRGADLAGVSLTGVCFAHAVFRVADLSYSRFHGCDFSFANFTGADLTKAVMSRCNFRDCKLLAAKLSGMRFDNSNVIDATLDSDVPFIDGGALRTGRRCYLWRCPTRGWRVQSGCWDYSVSECRMMISRIATDEQERMAMLRHLLEMARLRGYDVQ